jgi:hypothetical protein
MKFGILALFLLPITTWANPVALNLPPEIATIMISPAYVAALGNAFRATPSHHKITLQLAFAEAIPDGEQVSLELESYDPSKNCAPSPLGTIEGVLKKGQNPKVTFVPKTFAPTNCE